MLNESVLGHPVCSWLTIGALVVVSLLSALVVRLLWRWVLLPIARRTPTSLDLLIFERTETVAMRIATVAALYFTYTTAAEILHVDIAASAATRVARGVFFVALVALGSWAALAVLMAVYEWYTRELLPAEEGRVVVNTFTPVVQRVLKVAIFGIALIMVLSHFGVNVSGLLATAGIASLAVALAAQETLANVIGGFCLMADKAFRVGDRIELPDGRVGDVVELGLRTTRIVTLDETLLIVPNAELAKSRIINIACPTHRVRVRHPIGVAYGSDVELVKRILVEVSSADPDVLREPAPVAYFAEFGESALQFILVFWVGDYRNRLAALDRINAAVDRRFREAGIVIPFPQRDVHLFTMPAPGSGATPKQGGGAQPAA